MNQSTMVRRGFVPYGPARAGAEALSRIMAADLAWTPDSEIRVQCCGNAHLANFGGFESPERDMVFDINDFDETWPGPWEWDVKRLAASLAVAGRANGYPRKIRRGIVLAMASLVLLMRFA